MMMANDILSKMVRNKNLFMPLEIISAKPISNKEAFDAQVAIAWRNRKIVFIAKVKATTTPKIIHEALANCIMKVSKRENFLLIVPFLSKSIIEILEQKGMSGIDLNGNYLLQIPEMLAIRLDQPNQYRESQPIKKIFSANSSLVGRLFLATNRKIESVNEVCSRIQELGGHLSLSAISKVLKGLENELIIEKNKKYISLVQPSKLIQRLEEGYQPPKVLRTIKLKLPTDDSNALKKISRIVSSSTSWVLSGESSAERYAVTTPNEIPIIYTTNIDSLERFEDDRFYNVIVKYTIDSFPYFDAREANSLRWSSPIQSYLELSKLDKREQELAGHIRQTILESLE